MSLRICLVLEVAFHQHINSPPRILWASLFCLPCAKKLNLHIEKKSGVCFWLKHNCAANTMFVTECRHPIGVGAIKTGIRGESYWAKSSPLLAYSCNKLAGEAGWCSLGVCCGTAYDRDSFWTQSLLWVHARVLHNCVCWWLHGSEKLLQTVSSTVHLSAK